MSDLLRELVQKSDMEVDIAVPTSDNLTTDRVISTDPYAFDHLGSFITDTRDSDIPASAIQAAKVFNHGKDFPEHWKVNLRVDGRIIKIYDQIVLIDCLLDPDEEIFEQRQFPKSLLEGAVPVEIGQYVLIRIKQMPGKQLTTFHNGEKLVRKNLFEKVPGLEDLEGFDFEEKLI